MSWGSRLERILRQSTASEAIGSFAPNSGAGISITGGQGAVEGNTIRNNAGDGVEISAGDAQVVAPVLTFILPANVRFESASPGCTRAGATVTCTAPDIPVGASDARSVTVVPLEEGAYLSARAGSARMTRA